MEQFNVLSFAKEIALIISGVLTIWSWIVGGIYVYKKNYGVTFTPIESIKTVVLFGLLSFLGTLAFSVSDSIIVRVDSIALRHSLVSIAFMPGCISGMATLVFLSIAMRFHFWAKHK
jgi:hypothetical protein